MKSAILTLAATVALGVALWVAYPAIRGAPMRSTTAAVGIACCLAQIAAAIRWAASRNAGSRSAQSPPWLLVNVTPTCAILLASSAVADALGPLAGRWEGARWINGVFLGAVTAVQLWGLWRVRAT